ncbi:MAG: hypothetical protein K0R65_2729 [Crocinitomicaceae bacterium]|nr:hypothetical protein [Crocinitomicaceae bacterium]
MTEQKNTQKKKLSLILADLKAGPSAKTAKALDALQVYGDYTAIEPLFLFLLESGDEASKALVLEFLCNLKDSKSSLMVMDCLQQSRFTPIRNKILTTIWNSPLDYSIYLQDFVKIAVENDYLTTLECLTVIENLDGPFEEKSFLESLLYLKDYHEGKYPKSKEKDHLMSEIALLVKDFEQNSSDDDDIRDYE